MRLCLCALCVCVSPYDEHVCLVRECQCGGVNVSMSVYVLVRSDVLCVCVSPHEPHRLRLDEFLFDTGVISSAFIEHRSSTR